MANANQIAKLVDSNKFAQFKLTGTFDGTGQEINTIKIDVSSLALALNVNNKIMTSNTDIKSKYNVYVTRVFYSSSVTGWVKLHYDNNGGGDGTILVVGPGQATLDIPGFIGPNRDIANSNGDICITTQGALANNGYTFIVELRKDARDYDQGQTSDPQSFNRNP
jgi:hypothetical protein